MTPLIILRKLPPSGLIKLAPVVPFWEVYHIWYPFQILTSLCLFWSILQLDQLLTSLFVVLLRQYRTTNNSLIFIILQAFLKENFPTNFEFRKKNKLRSRILHIKTKNFSATLHCIRKNEILINYEPLPSITYFVVLSASMLICLIFSLK